MKKQLTILCSALALYTTAQAETKNFQASLTPDIAARSRDTHINGIAVSVWGENPQTAFALGFVNGSTGDSAGLSWSIFNYAENYTGVQWGIVNASSGTFGGWQSGVVNVANEMFGLQSGCVNIAQQLHGVQFGWVNYTATCSDFGVQIGLANIIVENQWFSEFPQSVAPGMVFVNWRFQ